MDIKVISADLDGRELKEQRRGRFVRCDGNSDQHEINEAIASAHRGRCFAGLGAAWDRIFGRRG